MEHLTKQQIVLLTLFTTFVTSIATGIVTVSLMDQAPVGVTGTVEQVIEHTVDQVASSANSLSGGDDNSAASANAASSAAGSAGDSPDPVADATALAEKSLVRIQLLPAADSYGGEAGDPKTTGLGIILSTTGLVVTDKSVVAGQGNYVALLPDGNTLPVITLQSQNNGDIAFLLIEQAVPDAAGPTGKAALPATNTPETFTPAIFAALAGNAAPRLGESVVALSGAENASVDQGIITKIVTDASSTPESYVTSIDPSETLIGSPLFDLSGDIIGIKTVSLETPAALAGSADASDIYYPVGLLKPFIPVLTSAKQ